jgi:C1A family cysteine protease
MRSFRPFLVIAAALLLCMVGVNGALAGEFKMAPINPEFEMYVSDLLKGKAVDMTPEGYGLGYMPPPIDLEAMNPELMLATPTPSGIPLSWDWRSSPGYSAVTTVKDQGSCGSCWAFGNIGAIESNYKKNIAGHPTLNLSENNMIDIRDSAANKYCHWPWLWTRCGGGNTYEATAYLTGLVKKSALLHVSKGVLTEANDAYNATAGYANPKCTATRPNPVRRIDGTRWVSSTTATMKNAVYAKGPMVTAYYAESPGGAHWYSNNTIYHYPSYSGSTNHMVLIVGYDDNKPWPVGTGKGAWLVKNSWGSFNSMGGYFWLTYGSAKVGAENMYYTSTRAYNAKEQIYMEDLPGWFSNSGCGTHTAYGLTVFAPLNVGEKMTHVEFYNPFANMTHTIKVYGTVTTTATGATVAGPLATKSITCQEPGYYTVALAAPLTLTKGKKYGVEIKFNEPASGTGYPIPIATTYSGIIGAFAGQGNATGYLRCGATGAYTRYSDMIPNIRARTTRP